MSVTRSTSLTTRQRYAAGIGFWAMATALSIGMNYLVGAHFVASFLAAVTLTGWYAGTGPAVLVFVLCMIADRTLPMLLHMSSPLALTVRDLWFATFSAGGAYFGVVRRRMESELQIARDHLETEVEVRTAELRRKEAYLEAAQRLSETGCWALPLSPSGRFWWSGEAARIYGAAPGATAAEFEALREFQHPDDRDRIRETTRAAMLQGRPFEIEYRIVRPDGQVRYVRGVGQPSLDADGNAVEYIGVVMDITERWRVEQALQRDRETSLNLRFAARLEERSRLAREMHDTLLQGFTGVSLKLVAATERMEPLAPHREELRDVIGLAQRTLAEARQAIWHIRAPSTDALPDALRAAVEEVVASTPIALDLMTRGNVQPLTHEAEDAILRVGREAVRNAVQHSHGQSVRVELRFRDHCVSLVVSDDGTGFAVEPELRSYGGHWGLLGMRERAAHIGGRLTIRSAPGAGTRVVLIVPFGRDAVGRVSSLVKYAPSAS